MRALHSALICLMVLTGCQTVPPEGLPPREFSFVGNKGDTKERLVPVFLSAGYSLVRDSDFQIVMDRPASDNFAAQLLFGSRFNGTPNARVSMTFLGNNPTKVVFAGQLVTNPNSGFEQSIPLDNAPVFRNAMRDAAVKAGGKPAA